MSATDRPLRNRILVIVHQDAARTVSELAEMTGATVAQVRSACWALCHTGQLDYCTGYFRAPGTAPGPKEGDVTGGGYAVPVALRGGRLVPRQRPGGREPMRVTPGAFKAAGLPVPEDPRQWNVYQLTRRQGVPWSPGVDAHTSRRGSELLGAPHFVCIDCDQQLAVDHTVWLSGVRWLADAATAAGEILDLTQFVAVRTPGDPDRLHGPGWHLWALADPDYPVRLGALKRCPAVEIKTRCTAPGSPGYVVRYAPEKLPVLPRWLAGLAGPPPAVTAASRRPGHGHAWERLEGILDVLTEAGPGDHRNKLLHWAACRCSEMIADGELDAATAEQVLYRAAEHNKHVAKHGPAPTLATIRSGLRVAVTV